MLPRLRDFEEKSISQMKVFHWPMDFHFLEKYLEIRGVKFSPIQVESEGIQALSGGFLFFPSVNIFISVNLKIAKKLYYMANVWQRKKNHMVFLM